MKTNIADRIKLLLGKKRCSQTDLANYLNVQRSTVNNWTTSIRTPSIEDIKKMAKFFNVSPAYIAGLSDNPSPVGNYSDLREVSFYSSPHDLVRKHWADKITFPASFLNARDEYAAVTCPDDSLKSKGIHQGDTLILNTSVNAGVGMIGLFEHHGSYIIRSITSGADGLRLAVPGKKSRTIDINYCKCIGIIEQIIIKAPQF